MNGPFLIVLITCVGIPLGGCQRETPHAAKPATTRPVPVNLAPAKPVARDPASSLWQASSPKPEPAVPSSAASQRVNLRLRILFDGPAPPAQAIQTPTGVAYCGDPSMKDESLLVDPATGGVQNVVMVWESPENGPKITPTDHADEFPIAQIGCQGCRFSPRVSLIRAGQRVEIANEDVLGHIVQVGFFSNPFFSSAVPIKQKHQVAPLLPEPSPAEVSCQLFPWMKAHVMVVDHPYAAMSDSEGRLLIRNLPVDMPLVFRLWHERGDFDEVNVDGHRVPVRRGRITLKLAADAAHQDKNVTRRDSNPRPENAAPPEIERVILISPGDFRDLPSI